MTPDLKNSSRNGHVEPEDESINHLPPHSHEAEQAILGCILLNADMAMPVCIERLHSNALAFYDLRHRSIYESIVWLYDERTPIDLVTLSQWLRDIGQLDGCGGIQYLATLPDCAPSASNIAHYLDIVLEKATARRLIQSCTNAVGRLYENDGSTDQESLVDEIERDILQIRQDQITQTTPSTRDLVHRAVARIEELHSRQGVITGLSTGFADLDKMTSGFNGGEMIVIAGRPSVGKSSLAMNIAEHVAVDLNLPVGVFSLEMTADSLMLRLLCGRARVNLKSIREGFLAERDIPRITSSAGKLASAPLYIDDSSGLSIMQLRAKARRMAQQYGIKLAVIDYLQLMHATGRKADNRQQEISQISGGVKALAKELNIPVIILSQLNREMERDKRKPKLSDLRESGAIEQDADFVGLLYKPSKEDGEDQHEQEAIPVNLLIAKQRSGPTGDVPLTFLKSLTRFESAARVSGYNDADDQQTNMPYNDQ